MFFFCLFCFFSPAKKVATWYSKILNSLLNYFCKSSYHDTLAKTHNNKFGQYAQNMQKLILFSTSPKCNRSESKRREQRFYLSAFLSVMKTHIQTKHTQM